MHSLSLPSADIVRNPDIADPFVFRAYAFAAKAHSGQKRRYTGDDYIVHPVEVATIVAVVPHDVVMLAAALLHDVVEDTPVTVTDIHREFGSETAELVHWLTSPSRPEHGSRRVRKAIDIEHTAAAPAAAQTIKLADSISNVPRILVNDPEFAVVYVREKRAMLERMTRGHKMLADTLREILYR